MTRGQWKRRLVGAVAAVPFTLAAALAAQLGVSASGSGSVNVGPVALPGNGQIQPGDVLSAGYTLRFTDGHPAATVHLVNANASLGLSCKQNASAVAVMTVGLADGAPGIPANDDQWHATGSTSDPAGYQGAATVPDVCGGKKIWVNTSSAPGVFFTGTLESAQDQSNQIQIEFHAVDAASSGSNADCRSGASSRRGGNPCDSSWSSPAQTNAAWYGPPPSSGAAPSAPAPGGGAGTGAHNGAGSSSPGSPAQGPGSGSGSNGGSGAGSGSGTGSSTGSSADGGTGPGSTSGIGTHPGSGTGAGDGSGPGSATGPGDAGVSSGSAGGAATGTGDATQPGTAAGSSADSSASAPGGVLGLSTPGSTSPAGSNGSHASGPAAAPLGNAPLTVVTSGLAAANPLAGVAPLAGAIGNAAQSTLSQLPVRWYLLLAAFDLLLFAGFVVRRRRARRLEA